MSERYPGGFITKTPPTLNPALGNSTPGVWTLDQVMQNIKAGTWPAYDPYFEYTTLLLHGNGTNGAQNNTFLDSSTNNFTITRNGNTTQGTFTPYGSNWSNYFDGSAAYLTTSSSAISYAGDFTVECWFSSTSTTTYACIYSDETGSAGGTILLNNGSNNGQITVYCGSISNFASTSTGLNDGKWHHVAFTRSGSTVRLFIDGALQNTTTASGTITTSSTFRIGNSYFASRFFGGYISNFRVTNTAVYTSAFTPPTGPLTAITNTSLLTCQSNRFVDNSSNAFAITVNGSPSVQRFSPFNPSAPYAAGTIGGSGYFDGTGDSLSLASGSTALPTGTQDFCVEMWLYWQTQGGSYPQIISNPTTNGFQIYYDVASGLLAVGIFNVSNIITYTIAQTALSGAWTHLAVTRSGNTFRMFVNGVLRANGTNTISFASLTTQYIGSDGSRPYTGYMSDVRTVLGSIPTSYQTSSTTNGTSIFTPTSAPLTTSSQGATSGDVELLCSFTNGGIIDNAMMNDLETVGNAQISTSVSKFGGGSLAFDGTGDFLKSPNTPQSDLSSGDFTIEFWFNTNTLTPSGGISPGYACIVGRQNWNGSSGAGWGVWQFNQTIMFFWQGIAGSFATGNVITSTGTWYHVAVVRSGTASNNTKIYINGVQQGQGTPTITSSTQPLTVGGTDTTVAWDSNYYINGYIDDLRITKGYARYTANFTPQTSQWQDQ